MENLFKGAFFKKTARDAILSRAGPAHPQTTYLKNYFASSPAPGPNVKRIL